MKRTFKSAAGGQYVIEQNAMGWDVTVQNPDQEFLQHREMSKADVQWLIFNLERTGWDEC